MTEFFIFRVNSFSCDFGLYCYHLHLFILQKKYGFVNDVCKGDVAANSSLY